MMEVRSILVGLAIGVCAFALTWATVRHFTGLAQEQGLALAIAVVVGVIVGVGYVVVESRLFDLWLRRRSR
jgi:tetrahydromethanopterin S-methyltransferase subunit E